MKINKLLTIAAIMLGLTATVFAANTRVVWEAETGKIENGNSFRVEKYKKDPSGKVSGTTEKNVLAIAKLPAGQKIKPDSASYNINIPEDGVYYLHVRALWSTGCGNSVGIKVSGYEGANWKVTSSTYDTLHWMAVQESVGVLKPLRLKKGVSTITLVALESGIKVDQLILTTDKEFKPAGIYKVTPDAVVADKK
ncbi:MAG: hypothetical protein WCO98_01070 [bacterium]